MHLLALATLACGLELAVSATGEPLAGLSDGPSFGVRATRDAEGGTATRSFADLEASQDQQMGADWENGDTVKYSHDSAEKSYSTYSKDFVGTVQKVEDNGDIVLVMSIVSGDASSETKTFKKIKNKDTWKEEATGHTISLSDNTNYQARTKANHAANEKEQKRKELGVLKGRKVMWEGQTKREFQIGDAVVTKTFTEFDIPGGQSIKKWSTHDGKVTAVDQKTNKVTVLTDSQATEFSRAKLAGWNGGDTVKTTKVGKLMDITDTPDGLKLSVQVDGSDTIWIDSTDERFQSLKAYESESEKAARLEAEQRKRLEAEQAEQRKRLEAERERIVKEAERERIAQEAAAAKKRDFIDSLVGQQIQYEVVCFESWVKRKCHKSGTVKKVEDNTIHVAPEGEEGVVALFEQDPKSPDRYVCKRHDHFRNEDEVAVLGKIYSKRGRGWVAEPHADQLWDSSGHKPEPMPHQVGVVGYEVFQRQPLYEKVTDNAGTSSWVAIMTAINKDGRAEIDIAREMTRSGV